MEDAGTLAGVFTLEKYHERHALAILEMNIGRSKYLEMLVDNPAHEAEILGMIEELNMSQRELAYDVSTFHNLLLNTGITLMWNLITGASGVHFDNTNSRLVVGTGATAAAASQTVSTFTSPVYLAMDVGYPVVSAQAASWRSTANTTTANQAWNEFAVTNGIAGTGVAMNRAVSAQGTKTSTDIWVPTLTISLS